MISYLISLLYMKNKLIYTFQNHLKESLKDSAFRKAWEESEVEYLLARELIEKRIKKGLSQRGLARKLRTSQAAISRIETMAGNPTLSFLKRIARILDVKLVLRLR